MHYGWIFFLLMTLGFAGCVGSFMNVVIYRLPRGIPLSKPLWSFCVHCGHSIRWYDNIPVLSYFHLQGRCRDCRGAIAPRYVIIEVVTVLAFLLLFDTFFVAYLRNGITSRTFGVGEQLVSDWPIYLAHVLLFACLIGMSAIDTEAYWVDIRFTHFAAAAGFGLHPLWATSRVSSWPRPGAEMSAAALAGVAGAVIIHLASGWYWSRRARLQQGTDAHAGSSDPSGDGTAPPQAPHVAASTPVPDTAVARPPSAGGDATQDRARTFPFTAWLAGLVLYYTLTLLVVTLLDQSAAAQQADLLHRTTSRLGYHPPDAAFALRFVPAVVFIFLAMIGSSLVSRPADQEIEAALEAERHGARKVAVLELLWILLPVALFTGGYLVVCRGGPLEPAWDRLWNMRLWGRYPFIGLGTAAVGFFISAAIGWTVRIVFTLILGKEAFGSGDIHIMAAAGAVAGWEVVAVGFFFSAILALFGWILTLPFKRGHALPMGPWLTLAFFVMVVFREPVIRGWLGPPIQLMLNQWFGTNG